MTTQCCVCHRVQEEGEWIRQMAGLKPVSHTYCPDCLLVLRDEMKSQLLVNKEVRPLAV